MYAIPLYQRKIHSRHNRHLVQGGDTLRLAKAEGSSGPRGTGTLGSRVHCTRCSRGRRPVAPGPGGKAQVWHRPRARRKNQAFRGHLDLALRVSEGTGDPFGLFWGPQLCALNGSPRKLLPQPCQKVLGCVESSSVILTLPPWSFSLVSLHLAWVLVLAGGSSLLGTRWRGRGKISKCHHEKRTRLGTFGDLIQSPRRKCLRVMHYGTRVWEKCFPSHVVISVLDKPAAVTKTCHSVTRNLETWTNANIRNAC